MSTLKTTTAADLSSLGATSNAGDTYFETTNNRIVVWDGTAWTLYNNDGIASPYSNTYSITLDGSNDLAVANVNIAQSTLSAYTVSAWVKVSSFGSFKGPYHLGGGSLGSYTSTNFLRTDSGTSIGYYHIGSSGYIECAYSSVNLSTGTWYHFMQVWDGSSIKLYLDGQLNRTVTVTGKTDSYVGTQNIIFSLGFGRSDYLNCNIDEFAWWDSDQSANIGEIRDSSLNIPKDLSEMATANRPKHWYRMGDYSGDTGTTITDQGYSSSTVDMTLTNGASIVSDTP